MIKIKFGAPGYFFLPSLRGWGGGGDSNASGEQLVATSPSKLSPNQSEISEIYSKIAPQAASNVLSVTVADYYWSILEVPNSQLTQFLADVSSSLYTTVPGRSCQS
jgi:hypothetical protein